MARIYFILLLVINLTLIANTSANVWECELETDCIDGANCFNNLCQCPQGSTFSMDGLRCLQHSIGYHAQCEDDAQCQWLTGRYVCNDGRCECGSGYRYLHGRCTISKGLGESCSRNSDCHVSNQLTAMHCSEEGICKCSEGFYPRGDYDCRPIVTEIGAPCALDTDCKLEGGGYCSGTRCTPITSERTTPQYNDSVQMLAEPMRRRSTYVIGSMCLNSEECSEIPNSICSPLNNQCVCKRGYYYSGGNCTGEVGVNVGCQKDEDCEITPKRCRDGACTCPSDYYYQDDLRGCARVAGAPLFSCTSELSCEIHGKGTLCVLAPNGFQRFCACPLNYELNKDSLCVPAATGGESNSCVVGTDCSIANAACVDRQCTCPENYRLEEETCLPNIGGACDSNTRLCQMEDASCTNAVCSCNPNYVAVNQTTCLPIAQELHDNCTYDSQCAASVPFSSCVNGECVCSNNYAENAGSCFESREYGAYCTNVAQCHVSLGGNIQCRNSVCQCPANMERSDDGLDCRTRSNAPLFNGSSMLFYILSLALCLLI